MQAKRTDMSQIYRFHDQEAKQPRRYITSFIFFIIQTTVIDVNGYFPDVTGGLCCGFRGIVPKTGTDELNSREKSGNALSRQNAVRLWQIERGYGYVKTGRKHLQAEGWAVRGTLCDRENTFGKNTFWLCLCPSVCRSEGIAAPKEGGTPSSRPTFIRLSRDSG